MGAAADIDAGRLPPKEPSEAAATGEAVDIDLLDYLGSLVLSDEGWVGPEQMGAPTQPNNDEVSPPPARTRPDLPEDDFDRDLREGAS